MWMVTQPPGSSAKKVKKLVKAKDKKGKDGKDKGGNDGDAVEDEGDEAVDGTKFMIAILPTIRGHEAVAKAKPQKNKGKT